MKKVIVLFSFLLLFSTAIWGQTAVEPDLVSGTYQISSLENLYWIAADSDRWGDDYIQTSDIDASETSTWFSGQGWLPIGNSANKFTGNYDGDGYSISDLTSNRPSSNEIGLFGEIDGQSTKWVVIENLTLIDVVVKGGDQVGGLVGRTEQFNKITNCHVSGSVEGRRNVGGLVGFGLRTDFLQCSSSADISVNNYTGALYHGSLIGHMNTSATVNECYATGNVSGRSRVGGLIGAIGWNSYVENSYATGNVESDTVVNPMIGGLIGEVWNAAVRYSYSTGAVDTVGVTSAYGGLVGSKTTDSNYEDTENFWDTETSGLDTSEMGTGKTTSDMKTQTTFTDADWDFTDIWSIDEGENNGYPYLQWQQFDDPPLPVELAYFSAQVTADIAVNLEWRTETETDMLGYNILRSETNNTGGAIKINPFLITAHNVSSAVSYSFLDVEVINGQFYFYWLEALEYDLTSHLYGPVSLLVDYEEEPGTTPTLLTTELIGAYPNPFNPATAIRFSLSEKTEVTIAIYNMLGQRVQTIVSEQFYPEGHHSVVWQGEDLSGKKAASGVYFYKMRTSDGFERLKKLVLLR